MMEANTEFSGHIVEVCYETNRFVVRFEGLPPEIGREVYLAEQAPAGFTEREQFIWNLGRAAGVDSKVGLPITDPSWQAVGDAIAEAIRNYRCSTLQDDAEEPLPLLDALCQVDGTSMQTAQHEAEMLADSILLALHSADATCALRGAQKESGWISVEERMPDTEDEVLVLTKHGVVMDRWRMQREAPLSFSSATIETGVYWDDHEFEDISHWMAIPSPPTPEGEAK